MNEPLRPTESLQGPAVVSETDAPVNVEATAATRTGEQNARLRVWTAEKADEPLWNLFVQVHPDANLGHSFEWKEIFENAYNKRCIYLYAARQNRVEGVLPLVYMGGLLGGKRVVSVPFLDQAGMLAGTEEARGALWQAAVEVAEKVHARGIDLRSGTNRTATADAPRATLVLSLPKSVDELWRSFRPKVRNQVRKSDKEGLETTHESPSRLGDFYAVFCENMRDLGSPVHDLTLFREVFRSFAKKARLYLTQDRDGRVIGGAIAIGFRSTLTVPWASSLRQSFRSCPNHSLYWRILSDAVDDGFERFDFGRSAQNSGTYTFKKQWGAQPYELEWKSHDALGVAQEAEHHLNPSKHGRLVSAWSRLPLWLANRLGPVLRRKLAN